MDKRALTLSAGPAAAAILDRDHLARQTFGDRALEAEILVLFAEQCGRLVPRLGPGGDRADRLAAAHTLKGAARAVGADQVAAWAQAIEEAAEEDLPRLAGGLAGAVAEAGRAAASRAADRD